MSPRRGEPNPRLAREKSHLVALLSLPSMNTRRLHEMLSLFGSPRGAWEAVLRGAARHPDGRVRWQAAARRTDVAASFADMIERGIDVVVRGEAGYPPALATIHDPPAALFVRGRLECVPPMVAVVGARKATPYGMQVGRSLAEGLALAGVAVVSGAAAGIDTAAHEGPLAAGRPTVAVLGCGVDMVYPRSNALLFERIARCGALVSEYAPGTEPKPHHFPTRNRIIAGMSRAVVVIEASEKSGALITAESALEEGRDVMAVPGQVFSANSRGPHALIRAGAALVRNAEDVLLELGLAAAAPRDAPLPGLQGSAERGEPLLNALEGGPLDAESLALATGSPVARTLATLTELEVRGLVVRSPGGLFQRVHGAR